MDSQQKTGNIWIPFDSWIAQQRGENDNTETDNEASSSSSTYTNENASETIHRQSTTQRPNSSVQASLARDCRMETRLLDGGSRTGKQDMTVMLAAPGMPLHKSPLVTTRQASALLSALCEPLVQVSVGRLTRRLDAPTMLLPTEERGTLSLWLLPNDDLSLVWQSSTQDVPTSPVSGGIMVSPNWAATSAIQSQQRAACEVTIWEELARFPCGIHSTSNEPVITIHMLRGDTSGRAFYIRPRADTTRPCLDAATVRANGFDAEFVQNMLDVHSGNSSSDGNSSASEEGRRMYFWLTGTDLTCASRSLGRIKSLIKRPPTLSKRSGVSQKHLNQISSWLQQLDSLAHQSTAAFQRKYSSNSSMPHPNSNNDTSGSVASSSGVSALLRHQPGSHAPLPIASQQIPTPFSIGDARQIQEDGWLSSTGAVSATAAAVYRDRRFKTSFSCAITVGASVALRGRPVDSSASGIQAASAELSTHAGEHAKAVAEDVARRAVDLIGRRNLEESICESLILSVRVQRAKAKAAAQAEKDRETRIKQLQLARPLIQKAVDHAVAHGGGVQNCFKSSSLYDRLFLQRVAFDNVNSSRSSSKRVDNNNNNGGDEVTAATIATIPPTSLSKGYSQEVSASTDDDAESPDSPPEIENRNSASSSNRVTIDDLQQLLTPSGSTRMGTATSPPASLTSSPPSKKMIVNLSELPELLENLEK